MVQLLRKIRDMVVSSLKGQDQAVAAKKAEESIERAKKLIEQHQAEMDRTLGGALDSDEADVPMPRLTPAVPSISLREFVSLRLKQREALVTDCGDGLFKAKSSNLGEDALHLTKHVLERFTQPALFMGRAPVLYQQGKAAFERLVQRWIDRSGAYSPRRSVYYSRSPFVGEEMDGDHTRCIDSKSGNYGAVRELRRSIGLPDKSG